MFRARTGRSLAAALFVLALLTVWVTLLFWFGPSATVDYLGAENTYLIIFLLAISGGLSSLTAGPFYATLGTFAAGGADPILLGVVAGASITVGDSLF